MIDIIAPLGVGLFIILFLFTLIYTARKNKEKIKQAIKFYATQNGWNFSEKDIWNLQESCKGFSFGRFKSIAAKYPIQNIANLNQDGLKIYLFIHSICHDNTPVETWTICFVELPKLAEIKEIIGDEKTSSKIKIEVKNNFLAVFQKDVLTEINEIDALVTKARRLSIFAQEH